MQWKPFMGYIVCPREKHTPEICINSYLFHFFAGKMDGRRSRSMGIAAGPGLNREVCDTYTDTRDYSVALPFLHELSIRGLCKNHTGPESSVCARTEAQRCSYLTLLYFCTL